MGKSIGTETFDTDMTIIRRYIVNDGYAGKQTGVSLAFKDGYAIEMSPSGYYRASGRKYQSEKEMLYYFDNHRNVHFPQVVRLGCPPVT